MDNVTLTARILIIDDEEDLRDILSYQFKAAGYEVQTAKDGLEGLERLKTFTPDLIVLDLNMPRMGGIEFYQQITDAEGQPRYHILVLTARANTRQLFMDFNVDGFMTKPFEAPDLLNEAKIIIQRSREDQIHHDAFVMKAAKNICVVDHRADDLNSLGGALSQAGYKVSMASAGVRAIERMMQDVPDVALINLGLNDMPGDIVVQRLMQMSKTRKIKFILYVHRNDQHDKAVLDNFSRKPGVIACVEYNDIKEILELIDRVIIKG